LKHVRATLLLVLWMMMTSAIATPACPTDSPWPPAFRLDYDARATRSILSLSGDSALILSRRADSYALVSETKAGFWFSARQSSRGRIGPDGVVPEEYNERNPNRPQMTTRFDWSGGQVSFTATDKIVATEPQMQDRLSLLLELGWPKRARAPKFDVPVAGVRGASIYHFVERGPETVDTPAGRFETVKLERPMDASDDRLEVWLAPSLCNLPVRVRFTDRKGTVIANELRSATFPTSGTSGP
jgi:hypothetical protein